jgi:hypothetical protein
MAVSLKTLLHAAPFPEAEREALLNQYDQLSDEQKLRLSNAAWTALSAMYFGRLKYETDKLLLEIQDGKRKFDKNEFVEIETKLTHEFAQKLQAAETQESLEEVRKNLEQFKSLPMAHDKSAPPPPQKQ